MRGSRCAVPRDWTAIAQDRSAAQAAPLPSRRRVCVILEDRVCPVYQLQRLLRSDMTTFPLYHQVDPAGVFPFLFATIAFLVATELLGTYLKFRQCHVLRNATPPRALVHVLQSIRAQTQHELREAAAQADGASEAAHVSAGTQQSASAQEDSGGQEGEDGAAGGGDGALPEPNANMSDEELQRYFDRSHAYARARIRLSLANAAFDLVGYHAARLQRVARRAMRLIGTRRLCLRLPC